MCTKDECISAGENDIDLHILECTFGRCDFATMNHLDRWHIYCYCEVEKTGTPIIVHFNARTSKHAAGRCPKCERIYVDYRDGRSENYMTDGWGKIIGSTYHGHGPDPEFAWKDGI